MSIGMWNKINARIDALEARVRELEAERKQPERSILTLPKRPEPQKPAA